MRRLVVVLAGCALALAACSSSNSSSEKTPTVEPGAAATASAAPSNTTWLCKPGIADNPCEGDLTATVVHADGSTVTDNAHADANAPIDCFYVYPTAANQPTANADLSRDPGVVDAARAQVSRFSQVCRVYTPIYRQLTIAGLLGGNLPPGSPKPNPAIAYQDVSDAFSDYLAHYNDGRGFVLIGHSQGAFILEQLIRARVDNDAAVRGRLVSAILLGGNVTVPDESGGATPAAGAGTFAHIPPCASVSQTGCVVAYSTFPSMPPEGSMFGRVAGGATTTHVLCVNPAAPGGGGAELHTYVLAKGGALTGFGQIPQVTTPWVAFPDEFRGECMLGGGAGWLQVTDAENSGAKGPRLSEPLGAGWGYHLLDVNLALGDLVKLVSDQSAAFRK